MPVAIKMLKHDMAMETDFLKNFTNEAKTIATFNHENIVKVYDIEECYQTIFIVREYLEGMSLRAVLKNMLRLPPKRVASYLLQVCAGLHYAHARGIVHQDIAPGNMFIQSNDKVKILDFGLACPPGSENILAGTPFYMSPEQVDCLPVDERTDIYSLGISAYEMVTGQRPYPEDDIWRMMDLHATQDIPDPAEIVPDLPKALRKIIIKACSRDPAHRYQKVAQITEDLQPLAADYGLTSQDVSLERPKMATLFLLYKEEHQPALSRLMDEFSSQVRELGVTCKAADLKEI